MKMKTNVQYIANATFAKLPDVVRNNKWCDEISYLFEALILVYFYSFKCLPILLTYFIFC